MKMKNAITPPHGCFFVSTWVLPVSSSLPPPLMVHPTVHTGYQALPSLPYPSGFSVCSWFDLCPEKNSSKAVQLIKFDYQAHLDSKPVSWLAVNRHHLYSDGAAVNTQSRSSLIALMHGLQGAEAQGPTLERGPTGWKEIIFLYMGLQQWQQYSVNKLTHSFSATLWLFAYIVSGSV